MLTQTTLLKSVKKPLLTALPIIALGLSSTLLVQTATAGTEAKKQAVAAELKSEANTGSITSEQREKLMAQLLAEGKTPEEAEKAIDTMVDKLRAEKQ